MHIVDNALMHHFPRNHRNTPLYMLIRALPKVCKLDQACERVIMVSVLVEVRWEMILGGHHVREALVVRRPPEHLVEGRAGWGLGSLVNVNAG